MKVRLYIHRAGARLYEGDHDIVDAKSFGEAFAGAWTRMQAQRLGKTTSVGDLMEAMGESELEELDGAEFTLWKV
jgi:hypothetical protein